MEDGILAVAAKPRENPSRLLAVGVTVRMLADSTAQESVVLSLDELNWRDKSAAPFTFIGIRPGNQKGNPLEEHNLIFEPEQQKRVAQLKSRMFDELEKTGGMYIPLYRDRGRSLNLRREGGSKPGNFPEELIRDLSQEK